jgi:hypothetical protein
MKFSRILAASALASVAFLAVSGAALAQGAPAPQAADTANADDEAQQLW